MQSGAHNQRLGRSLGVCHFSLCFFCEDAVEDVLLEDELVLEVPEAELEPTRDLVRECMESAVELDVPLKVDFGHGANWLEAH